jgi:hypothetical protein
MPTWITVDEETASALRARLPEQAVVEFPERSPMEYVLDSGETTVAVLPGRGLGQAALAVFRWTRVPPPISAPPQRANTRAGGFLGLSDESMVEEEPEEKKSWWKRFWED